MNYKSRKITIHTSGNVLNSWIHDGILHYSQQCKRWIQTEHMHWQKIPNTPESHWEKLSPKIESNHLVVALDVKGKTMDSYQFSQKLRKLLDQSSISFIVGGAFGLSEQCLNASNDIVSLSNLTYSHTIVPIVLMEQIYRGMSLIHNHPYHKS